MMINGRCLSEVDSTSICSSIISLYAGDLQNGRPRWYSEVGSVTKGVFIWPQVSWWRWSRWYCICMVDIILVSLQYWISLILLNWNNALPGIIAEIKAGYVIKILLSMSSSIYLYSNKYFVSLAFWFTYKWGSQSPFCTTILSKHCLPVLVLWYRREALLYHPLRSSPFYAHHPQVSSPKNLQK